MTKLISSNNNFSKKLGVSDNLDFSNVLMVVDMQRMFIECYLKSLFSVSSIYFVECLIFNIKKRIVEALDKNQLIIIVEYENYGDTIPEISELLKKVNDRVITLRKNNKGLMNPNNNQEHFKESKEVISFLQEIGSSIEVTGINTTDCVLKTAKGIYKEGIGVNIPLGTTLNIYVKNDFKYENKIHRVQELYGNSSHLLNTSKFNVTKIKKKLNLFTFGILGSNPKFLYDYVELIAKAK